MCDVSENFFQGVVKETCKAEKDVSCVFAKWPQCSADDICKLRNGCGYVVDNSLVKFTSYTCTGSIGFGPKDPSASFEISCDPALTPLGVGGIVALSILALLCC